MSRKERPLHLRPRMQQAIEELKGMLLAQYPDAVFQVVRGPDDPQAIFLTTTADFEDIDDVLDVVIDRLQEMQIEQNLPIHVLPLRTPERNAVLVREQEARNRAWEEMCQRQAG